MDMIRTIAAMLLIVLGCTLDILSFVLAVRRLRGNGPSGIPVVPLVMESAGALLLGNSLGIGWSTTRMLLLLALGYHVTLQFLLPLLLHVLLRTVGK